MFIQIYFGEYINRSIRLLVCKGVVLNLIPSSSSIQKNVVSQSSIAPLANLDLIMTAKHPSSALTKLQSIIRSASPDQNQQLIKVINSYQDNAKGGLFEHHFLDFNFVG